MKGLVPGTQSSSCCRTPKVMNNVQEPGNQLALTTSYLYSMISICDLSWQLPVSIINEETGMEVHKSLGWPPFFLCSHTTFPPSPHLHNLCTFFRWPPCTCSHPTLCLHGLPVISFTRIIPWPKLTLYKAPASLHVVCPRPPPFPWNLCTSYLELPLLLV